MLDYFRNNVKINNIIVFFESLWDNSAPPSS